MPSTSRHWRSDTSFASAAPAQLLQQDVLGGGARDVEDVDAGTLSNGPRDRLLVDVELSAQPVDHSVDVRRRHRHHDGDVRVDRGSPLIELASDPPTR
jgi:hypothetical protein